MPKKIFEKEQNLTEGNKDTKDNKDKNFKKEKKDFCNILIRGTNWVGDAIMTLPALKAVSLNFPDAKLTVLSKAATVGVYQSQPGVSGTLVQAPDGAHRGFGGQICLARELAASEFDLGILFQNAFGAALVTALGRVPRRWGYARDGRSFLLTKAVKLQAADHVVHQSFYYLNLLQRCGLEAPFTQPRILPSAVCMEEVVLLLNQAGLGRHELLLALAPGAAYGPAKRWPVESFARAAEFILGQIPGRPLILGGQGEMEDAARLDSILYAHHPINLAGKTTFSMVTALMARSGLLLTNDSGLMHLGGAVGTPLVAVFGPTDPRTTSPLGGTSSRIICSTAPCAPCLKRECPLPERICFSSSTPELVARNGLELIDPAATDPNLSPAVFLDRDGTLIEEVDFLSRPEDVRLIPGAGAAVARLNKAGYKVVLVTNQSGIARGFFKQKELDFIHVYLEQLLSKERAFLDGIYVCPHHPEAGGVAQYSKACNCRKPAPGLFQMATLEMGLDPSRSIWIGDRWRDLEAAEKMGGRSARTVLVTTGYGVKSAQDISCRPTLVAPDLARAVEWILS